MDLVNQARLESEGGWEKKKGREREGEREIDRGRERGAERERERGERGGREREGERGKCHNFYPSMIPKIWPRTKSV